MLEKVITMVLFDGTVSGIIEYTLDNWNGVCYRIPRSKLIEANRLEIVDQQGIYILIGEDELTGKEIIYIGKSTGLKQRINNHDRNKPFWNELIAFISKDNDINIGFLEGILLEKAKSINIESDKYIFDNTQTPIQHELNRGEKIKTQRFKEKIILVMNALKYKIFDDTYIHNTVGQISDDHNVVEETPRGTKFYLKSTRNDLYYGEGILTDEGFLVLKGSRLKPEFSEAISPSLMARFIAERNSEDIVDFTYVRNHLFKSPSMAGTVITGSNCNGRASWKTEDGRTLGELTQGL